MANDAYEVTKGDGTKVWRKNTPKGFEDFDSREAVGNTAPTSKVTRHGSSITIDPVAGRLGITTTQKDADKITKIDTIAQKTTQDRITNRAAQISKSMGGTSPKIWNTNDPIIQTARAQAISEEQDKVTKESKEIEKKIINTDLTNTKDVLDTNNAIVALNAKIDTTNKLADKHNQEVTVPITKTIEKNDYKPVNYQIIKNKIGEYKTEKVTPETELRDLKKQMADSASKMREIENKYVGEIKTTTIGDTVVAMPTKEQIKILNNKSFLKNATEEEKKLYEQEQYRQNSGYYQRLLANAEDKVRIDKNYKGPRGGWQEYLGKGTIAAIQDIGTNPETNIITYGSGAGFATGWNKAKTLTQSALKTEIGGIVINKAGNIAIKTGYGVAGLTLLGTAAVGSYNQIKGSSDKAQETGKVTKDWLIFAAGAGSVGKDKIKLQNKKGKENAIDWHTKGEKTITTESSHDKPIIIPERLLEKRTSDLIGETKEIGAIKGGKDIKIRIDPENNIEKTETIKTKDGTIKSITTVEYGKNKADIKVYLNDKLKTTYKTKIKPSDGLIEIQTQAIKGTDTEVSKIQDKTGTKLIQSKGYDEIITGEEKIGKGKVMTLSGRRQISTTQTDSTGVSKINENIIRAEGRQTLGQKTIPEHTPSKSELLQYAQEKEKIFDGGKLKDKWQTALGIRPPKGTQGLSSKDGSKIKIWKDRISNTEFAGEEIRTKEQNLYEVRLHERLHTAQTMRERQLKTLGEKHILNDLKTIDAERTFLVQKMLKDSGPYKLKANSNNPKEANHFQQEMISWVLEYHPEELIKPTTKTTEILANEMGISKKFTPKEQQYLLKEIIKRRAEDTITSRNEIIDIDIGKDRKGLKPIETTIGKTKTIIDTKGDTRNRMHVMQRTERLNPPLKTEIKTKEAMKFTTTIEPERKESWKNRIDKIFKKAEKQKKILPQQVEAKTPQKTTEKIKIIEPKNTGRQETIQIQETPTKEKYTTTKVEEIKPTKTEIPRNTLDIITTNKGKYAIMPIMLLNNRQQARIRNIYKITQLPLTNELTIPKKKTLQGQTQMQEVALIPIDDLPTIPSQPNVGTPPNTPIPGIPIPGMPFTAGGRGVEGGGTSGGRGQSGGGPQQNKLPQDPWERFTGKSTYSKEMNKRLRAVHGGFYG